MVYLDYSATTPINKEVLKTFDEVTLHYNFNPNSLHKLGVAANEIIESSTKQIADLLNIKAKEIIYTSGSSEANNMAIKGIALKYSNRGKHIITTSFEHSSIYGPLNYLQKQGFTVDIVNTDSKGLVDLDDLKLKLTDETVLVTIGAVNSEIGIIQPINEIGNIIKEYPKCYFHIDATQALGKINIDLFNVDLASFSAHKIYGIKGIGFLYKKESIVIEPLIHGGKSTTVFRSGTPATGLNASLSKAVRLVLTDLDKNYKYVLELKNYLFGLLKNIEGVYINSNDVCIPHIVNLSVVSVKPETLLHALEKYDIYISTQTACSSSEISQSVLALTNDTNRASSSIRISLSHLTTKEEINYFINKFEIVIKELKELKS